MPLIYDGGPAFPRPFSNDTNFGDYGKDYQQQDGMSLRDYWAGQVVNGELAGLPPDGRISPEALARWGFKVADAMLAERDRDIIPET